MQIFLRFSFQERLWSSSWTCFPALQSVQLSDNPHICIFWRSLVTARTRAVGQWPKAFPWQLCAKATVPQAKNAPDGSSLSLFFLLNNWNNTLTATGVASPLIWSYWHWVSPGRWKDWSLWFVGPACALQQPQDCPRPASRLGILARITSSDVANESWHSGPMFWAVHF